MAHREPGCHEKQLRDWRQQIGRKDEYERKKCYRQGLVNAKALALNGTPARPAVDQNFLTPNLPIVNEFLLVTNATHRINLR